MSGDGGSLVDYLVTQLQRDPQAIAIAMGEERLTYEELERLSARVAGLLVAVGCDPGDRVALLTPKSPRALVAMLGTLRAGGIYVPIDVASPVQRIAKMLVAAEPSAVIALGRGADLVAELRESRAIAPGVPIAALDDHGAEVTAATIRPAFGPADLNSDVSGTLPPAAGGDLPAHILFTSGSTGDPKGVVITHANVRAFIDWAVPYFDIGAADRLSGHPPLHFDLSTFDIYGSLCAGAELHLVPDDVVLPHQLAAFIADRGLTQWFSVPSTMSYLAQFGAVPEDGFPSLRRVLWCGEVLALPTLVHWMQRIPQARYTNLYGPTETTIASSHYEVRRVPAADAGPLPIGFACAGEELVVLDDSGTPAADGDDGEICIGGAGLSPGYWRDERRTARAFIPDPRAGRIGERLYRTGDLGRARADGALQFLGRADTQIKSRGYRIELGEIEVAISQVAGVAECAVLAVQTAGFEGRTICCAYAPVKGTAIEAFEIRTAAGALLPTYMLPSKWRAAEQLPRNQNGKIDRRRLQELFAAEMAGAGARGV